jgi:hypothetical protein
LKFTGPKQARRPRNSRGTVRLSDEAGSWCLTAQDAQKGCSERRGEAYAFRYVELLNDARTKLADFFSILLETPRSFQHCIPLYGRTILSH